MTCDECLFRLPEYFDGESGDPGEIERHAAACPSCSARLAALRREASLYVRYHPLPVPSPDLWGRVEARIGRRRRTIEALGPGLRRWAPALAAATVVAAWGWWALRPAAQTPWTVSPASGPVSVVRRAGARVLDADGWVRTGKQSLRLSGDAGTIDVGPDTRLRLVRSDKLPAPGASVASRSVPIPPLDAAAPSGRTVRFRLAKGTVHATLDAPAGVFFVETPSGVVEDLGCSFTATVGGGGDLHLGVTVGSVSVEHRGRRSYVPRGAECDGRPWSAPGTPYRADAPAPLVRALSELDFGSRPSSGSSSGAASVRQSVLTPPDRSRLLGTVLAQARPSDLVSLWSLLSHVPAADRGAIYDRMAALARVPFGITREGIVRLDPQMMDRWREFF